MTEKQLDLKKFPNLEIQILRVETYKKLIDFLLVRNELIFDNFASKSQYEQNEANILLCQTQLNLADVHNAVIQTEARIKKDTAMYIQIIDEMNAGKWDEFFQKGLTNREKFPQLDKMITEFMEGGDFTQTDARKVHFYVELRNYIIQVVEGNDKSKNGLKVVS